MKIMKRNSTGTVVVGEIARKEFVASPVVRAIVSGNHAAVDTTTGTEIAPHKDPLMFAPKLTSVKEGQITLSGELGQKIEQILADSELTGKERLTKIYKVGVKAREIGRGDVEVYNLWVQVRQIQKGLINRDEFRHESVDADAFEHWSAQFIAGFNSKPGKKGGGAVKPYRLTVTIQRKDHLGRELPADVNVADFETFGKAEHAGMRWWVLKSETTEHTGMEVVIDTVDIEATAANLAAGGTGKVFNEKLRFCMTRDMAASMYEKQRRRADAGPATPGKPKGGGRLSFGVKVKEYRATFSGG